MNELNCAQVREVGAELALGILPGEERAAAVAHIDRCPECREYVEQLTLVGDGLLDLLPASEPPPGFETRVTSALGLTSQRRGRPPQGPRRWGRHQGGQARSGRRRGGARQWGRRLRLAAAAAVIALVAGLGGWAVGAATSQATPAPAPSHAAKPLLRATLVADRHKVGTVYAYPGSPGWVYMSVDLDHTVRGVTCELVRRDGGTVRVGWFALEDGYGYWGAPADVERGTLTGVRLVAHDGSILATARFT
jgi:hypothetical protein